MKTTRRWRRWCFLAIGLLLAGGLALLLIDRSIAWVAGERVFEDVNNVPERPVGLVLGCNPMMPDGRLNLFFTRRMDAAAALWKAGKVKRLLVSGASDARGYNEPISMRDAIVARGVPIEVIDMDPSGFRTLDSVVRAKTVFGATRMTMVSQRFHDERAIFLADHSGVDAVGFAAREVGSFEGWWHRGREVLARGKVLLDVYVLGTRPAVEADTPPKPLPAGW